MKENKRYLIIFQWCIGILISSFLVTASGFCAQESPDHSVLNLHSRHATENRQTKPAIILRDGSLSVNLPSTTLKQAVKEISRVAGIEVDWSGPDSDKQVSYTFSGRNIEEALQEILHGENYILSYSSQGGVPIISKVIVLPGGTAKSSSTSIEMNTFNQEQLRMSDAEDRLSRELAAMEKEEMKRVKKFQEIKAIAMLDDTQQAQGELMVELSTNEEPEARLLALNILNEIEPLSVDTLIETVSSDEDPRVKIQAIDYLMKRAEQDPEVEGFLTSFFESQMGGMH